MSRTSASDSRERMLDAAITLLRGSGLSGPGVNEIVRASGAPKGSVYHYFPQGKVQITREALTVDSTRVTTFIDAARAGKRATGRKVAALFAAFARRVEEGEFRKRCARGTHPPVTVSVAAVPVSRQISASAAASAVSMLAVRRAIALR